MVVKVVRVDEICKGLNINLCKGKHIIGRDTIVDCDDQRLTDNHGTIMVFEDNMTITASQDHHWYFKRKTDSEKQILQKNCTIDLYDGDMFGLLEKSFWFEIFCTNYEDPPPDLFEFGFQENDNIGAEITLNSDNEEYQFGIQIFPSPEYRMEVDGIQLNPEISDGIDYQNAGSDTLSYNVNYTTNNANTHMYVENVETAIEAPVYNIVFGEVNKNILEAKNMEDKYVQTISTICCYCVTQVVKKFKRDPPYRLMEDKSVQTTPIKDCCLEPVTVESEPDEEEPDVNQPDEDVSEDNAESVVTSSEEGLNDYNNYGRSPVYQTRNSYLHNLSCYDRPQMCCSAGSTCTENDANHLLDYWHPLDYEPPPLSPGSQRNVRVVLRRGYVFYINAHLVKFYEDGVEVLDMDSETVIYKFKF